MRSIAIGSTLAGPNDETFELTQFLGRGGFGEVYRAVGKSRGGVVAVKLLPGGQVSPERERALLNEIRATQQIKHPNVVQILHVNDGSSTEIGPYVIMEFVSGGTLAALLKSQAQSGQIPLPRAIEMMVHIAQGAKAINEKIIHRDIKPDNILIDGAVLKIGDFGISKFVEESTRSYTFKGGQHAFYMAPEGWQGHTNSFKLDVYSVGLVFYQILTLRHPLLDKVKSSNDTDWQNAHLFQQCPEVRSIRSEVPLSVSQLLTRMVSKKPDQRPAWDEVLTILTRPQTATVAANNAVTAAVQAVASRHQEVQNQQLKTAAQQDQRQQELDLYRYSCAQLLEQLRPIVNQFNAESQHGQITLHQLGGTTIYRVPYGLNIEVTFFPPQRVKIRSGELIGGLAWTLERPKRKPSVVKHGADDLYGTWSICELKIMGLIRPHTMIGQFGLTKDTVEPFGLKDRYFYDHTQHAGGGTHVFTYRFRADVTGYFTGLLLEAVNSRS